MEMKRKIITRPCSCRCCMLVIEKTMWEDGDVDYDISLQDSHFDHNYHTLWGRLKRAAKALFGKPVLYRIGVPPAGGRDGRHGAGAICTGRKVRIREGMKRYGKCRAFLRLSLNFKV